MPPLDDETVNAAEARDRFAEIFNRAAFGKERVVLSRRGKALAAIVPLDDLRLLEELEDRRDLRDAKAALAEWEASGRKSRPLDDVARDLGAKR